MWILIVAGVLTLGWWLLDKWYVKDTKRTNEKIMKDREAWLNRPMNEFLSPDLYAKWEEAMNDPEYQEQLRRDEELYRQNPGKFKNLNDAGFMGGGYGPFSTPYDEPKAASLRDVGNKFVEMTGVVADANREANYRHRGGHGHGNGHGHEHGRHYDERGRHYDERGRHYDERGRHEGERGRRGNEYDRRNDERGRRF